MRQLVNLKDSSTRTSQAHDEERAARIKARTSELERLARRKARLQALRDRLNDLLDEDDPRKRGTALEGVLNDLLATEGILIRESFSAPGFTGPAIEESERALNQRVIVLGELRELVLLLERQGDVAAWLREKVRFAQLERRPLALPGSDF